MAVKIICGACGAEVKKEDCRKMVLYSYDYSNKEELDKDICPDCLKKLDAFLSGDMKVLINSYYGSNGGFVKGKLNVECFDNSSMLAGVMPEKPEEKVVETFASRYSKLIVSEYERCVPISKLARRYHCEEKEIKHILSKAGYSLNSTEEQTVEQKGKLKADEETINRIRGCVKAKYTTGRIAKEFNVNYKAMWAFMKNHGIAPYIEPKQKDIHYENMPKKAKYVYETDNEGFIKDIREIQI